MRGIHKKHQSVETLLTTPDQIANFEKSPTKVKPNSTFHMVSTHRFKPALSARQDQHTSPQKDPRPSNRQDAILLQKWFDDALKLISNSSEEDKLSYQQMAHNICIDELARQVSVFCGERGQLLR